MSIILPTLQKSSIYSAEIYTLEISKLIRKNRFESGTTRLIRINLSSSHERARNAKKNPSSRVMNKKTKKKREGEKERKEGRSSSEFRFFFFFSPVSEEISRVRSSLVCQLHSHSVGPRVSFRLQISRVSAETVHAIINGDGRRGR